MVKHVKVASVIQGAAERWQSLGYGPGRRQSAYEAGALPALTAGMRAHPTHVGVQEKACLAIANICSGVDEPGLERKRAAFEAGAIGLCVKAMSRFPDDEAVCENG